MTDDEADLFLDEMSDVVPLKRAARVRVARQPSERDSSLAARREAAVVDGRDDGNILTEDGLAIEPLDPWYVLDFKRPGVQNGVFRKLLAEGTLSGEFRADIDPGLATILVLSMINALDRWYRPTGVSSPGEIADAVFAFTMRGIA